MWKIVFQPTFLTTCDVISSQRYVDVFRDQLIERDEMIELHEYKCSLSSMFRR